MSQKFGIDVSTYQGDIEWSQVKNSQYSEFAIIKITVKGNTVESRFEQNYRGATENRIPVGAYKYVYAKTVQEAKVEAEAAVSVLNGRPLPAMFWIDMEDKTIRNLSNSALEEIINAEAEVLEAAGYKVGIYCNNDWYKNKFNSSAIRNKYKFWIARYSMYDDGTLKESLKPDGATIWQFSSKGKVQGIKDNCDINIQYEEFIDCNNTQSNNTEDAPPQSVITDNDGYPLKRGSVGDNVLSLQTALKNTFDIDPGNVDGKFGPDTETAVRLFQLYYGLAVDGIVGGETLEALKSQKLVIKNKYAHALQSSLNTLYNSRLICDGNIGPATVKACPVLKNGSDSLVVKAYQNILINVYGIIVGKSGADGKYGSATATATMRLQKDKKLSVDGIVGPNTWKAISKDI